MQRPRLRDDAGSTLPLVIFYGFLALALVLIVAAAASLYLERKRLFTLADGAALVGAESFDLDSVTFTRHGPRPVLQPGQVSAAVASYLAGNPTGTEYGEFEGLVVERATTVDGESATVTVSAVWHPPVVTVFVPEGLRIDATAVARSVFG
ncbi:MAG: pilus assembly protein TadG-related protein [Pseudolysinimonas sp.]